MTGWIAADDVNRLVREIDVALNGVDAAPQAKLCDITAQVCKAAREFGPILQRLGVPPKPAGAHSDDWAIATAFREVTGPNGGLIKNDEVVDFISARAREMIANASPAGAVPILDRDAGGRIVREACATASPTVRTLPEGWQITINEVGGMRVDGPNGSWLSMHPSIMESSHVALERRLLYGLAEALLSAAPAPQQPDQEDGWQQKAAKWLEQRAVEQEQANGEHPRHADAYKEWRDRPMMLRMLAQDIAAAGEPQATIKRNCPLPTWMFLDDEPAPATAGTPSAASPRRPHAVRHGMDLKPCHCDAGKDHVAGAVVYSGQDQPIAESKDHVKRRLRQLIGKASFSNGIDRHEALELLTRMASRQVATGITAEWVKGYLQPYTSSENRQAIDDAFAEWAVLHPTMRAEPAGGQAVGVVDFVEGAAGNSDRATLRWPLPVGTELFTNPSPAAVSGSEAVGYVNPEKLKTGDASMLWPKHLALSTYVPVYTSDSLEAELIERFRVAVRALIGIRQPPATEGQLRPIYAEDVETMVDVLRVLEGLAQQTEAATAAVAGASAEAINALADWVQQCADACWDKKHTLQLEDVAKRIRALENHAQQPAVSNTTAALIDMLRQRDAAGRAKYGTTLDRTDLSQAEWLQHMAEEMLDGAGYALAAIRTLNADLALAPEAVVRARFESCAQGFHSRDYADGYLDALQHVASERQPPPTIQNGES